MHAGAINRAPTTFFHPQGWRPLPRGEFGLDVIALVGSLRYTSPFARGVMHTVRYDQPKKKREA